MNVPMSSYFAMVDFKAIEFCCSRMEGKGIVGGEERREREANQTTYVTSGCLQEGAA